MSFLRLSVSTLCLLAASVSLSRAETVTFDFDDNGLSLANGQVVESPDAFGDVFDIVSIGPNLGATVFDSSPMGANAASLDQDLLVNMGNILILQSLDFPDMTSAGIFDTPNDAVGGGELTFDFSPANFAVGLESIDVIDLDQGAATLTLVDGAGLARTIMIPQAFTGDITQGEPGVATIDLTGGAQESPNIPGLFTLVTSEAGFNINDIATLTFNNPNSGALDNLVFVPEPTTGLLLLVGGIALARRRRATDTK